ncbi:MAG: molybdopterin-dependent oxidoreductase [Nevskiales bacterium]
MSVTVKTTCPYCGVGCGVLATPRRDGGVDIAGDPRHPANLGKLCVKGATLGETLGREDRLLYPVVRGQRASWDEALGVVAQGFQKIIREHGPDAVAFYVSGQLLTEDYYAANKLIKGFIGTANIDTNSRLCMSSAVVGHKRAFGADAVPICYEDFDETDLVVLVGSNTAWCHPVIHQRILKAREARPDLKIVVVDPRRTATCEQADLHLPVKAGTDVWLFNGLLAYLHGHGVVDTAFVDAHTEGAQAAIAVAEKLTGSVGHVARACGISVEKLNEFYRLFARTERVITVFSQGVNQSSSGVDKVNSIINCHLLTGRIGKPGRGPFSVTGQPNAMGGREVGGLATMLAAHMDTGNTAHRELVKNFWKAPTIPGKNGLKAVDLFDAIHAGKVKAVWIMATNPVVSMPDADKVRAALEKCELVVVSDVLEHTDTTTLAHVLLPAAAWGEKEGTVTNSDRRISRQRAFLSPPGEAKPDWWIVSEVARRLGFGEAFSYQSARDVFVEHARLSGERQDEIPRAFNIAGLAELGPRDYDELQPIAWPVPDKGHTGTQRLFTDGRYYTDSGKARFLALTPRGPQNMPDDDYPLVLNTGRIRDQWHTMTRTGRSPKLANHLPEPFVEMHPYDAMLCGVQDGALARVVTNWGACVLRVRATADQPRRQVFIPIHWNDQFASDARVGALVNPAVDPLSGEPEFKHTPCRLEPFRVEWHGFVLARAPLPNAVLGSLTWWTRIQGQQFLRYEIGGREKAQNWSDWGRQVLSVADANADWLEYVDHTAGLYRGVWIVNDSVEACVFVSREPNYLPARAWLAGLFVQGKLKEEDRVGLLVGAPLNPKADTGPQVCACFGIGRNTILDIIRGKGCKTPGEVGAILKTGTNCGSCVPEIRALIALAAAIEAA